MGTPENTPDDVREAWRREAEEVGLYKELLELINQSGGVTEQIYNEWNQTLLTTAVNSPLYLNSTEVLIRADQLSGFTFTGQIVLNRLRSRSDLEKALLELNPESGVTYYCGVFAEGLMTELRLMRFRKESDAYKTSYEVETIFLEYNTLRHVIRQRADIPRGGLRTFTLSADEYGSRMKQLTELFNGTLVNLFDTNDGPTIRINIPEGSIQQYITDLDSVGDGTIAIEYRLFRGSNPAIVIRNRETGYQQIIDLYTENNGTSFQFPLKPVPLDYLVPFLQAVIMIRSDQ
ncbi:hypothetical protein KC622_02740 [Candidatus Dojkabacteria bacterium]|uniref:Uncharacterized protein n=1 Tax=Candidatus Dojkabacteria bacterium TaxID=2099670 RepID=A0A955HZX1_9BACT|nr:hypothetical protein [Candidatus Dojkabacteria bacterium]